MESSCFDQNRHALRRDLLLSAMREGVRGRPAAQKPLEDMTTFKPFNVRETKWDVWDVKESKYEQYLNLHQQRGMFDISQLMAPSGGAPPPHQPGSLMPNLNSVPNVGQSLPPRSNEPILTGGSQRQNNNSAANSSQGNIPLNGSFQAPPALARGGGRPNVNVGGGNSQQAAQNAFAS